MNETPDVNILRRELEKRRRVAAAIRQSVFSSPDLSGNDDLLRRLAAEEMAVEALEQQIQEASARSESDAKPPAESAQIGRFLRKDTTGLTVQATMNMQPVPTGIYNLLDPQTDPLLTILIANDSRDTKRVCVKVRLEGLSAQAVRSVELKYKEKIELKLLPTLLADRAKTITEIQRVNLHV